MKHLELFSGIGGFRLATDLIRKDGFMPFECIGFSEIDKNAIKTYCANYSTQGEVEIGDIVSFTSTQERISSLPDFDLLTGGFPCQTFSMMGRKTGFESRREDRGQMFFRIADILAVKNPKYVLLENVKNLFTLDKGNTYQVIESTLKELDYNVAPVVLNSTWFGLPQNRSRVIIFGTREYKKDDLKSIFTAEAIRAVFEELGTNSSLSRYKNVLGILSKSVSEKYLLSERIKPTILADGSAGFKSKSDINQLIARPLTASMHKMHRACQDNYYSIDFIQSSGKTDPSKTLSKDELAHIPIRKITPEEAFMLQGFPSAFVNKARLVGVPDGALYKQAGNAVSVNTIYSVLYFLIKKGLIAE